VDAVDSPGGSGAMSQTAVGGRIYASPSHICPSNHHVHCDKYDTTASSAAPAYWFETSLRPSTANQLCWNQTVKFLAPSDDELLATSPHDPYSVDRSWTAVGGTDPVNL